MASNNKFILSNFKDALDNMHNFFNPFSKGKSFIIYYLGKNRIDFFNYSENLCSICYNNFIIPSYVDSCKHKFCLCCIVRWINQNTKCPLCRADIFNILYIDDKIKGKEAIIQAKSFYKNEIKDSSKKIDSKYCIICNNDNKANELLLCPICKYNLIHLKCAGINDNHICDFICLACRNN